MKIGDKVKWFSIQRGWKEGVLLVLPKSATDEFCYVHDDFSDKYGYIPFCNLEKL